MELAGEVLLLDPDRALVWPARRTAFIADLHLGKDEVFRRRGVPIPQGSTQADLQRLRELSERHSLKRIVLLGDFLHAAAQGIPTHAALFRQWRVEHRHLQFTVIAGNHDRHAAGHELADAVQWEGAGMSVGPFICLHEAPSRPQGFALCGHLHPTVRLRGSHREKVRVPAFWVRPDHAILPSFGSFTGGADLAAEEGDRLFAFAAGKVWRVA